MTRAAPALSWIGAATLSTLLAPAPARADSCSAPTPVHFFYPPAHASGVPPNAVPFAIPDGLVQIERFVLDERHTFRVASELGAPAARFEPGQLLTPGKHQLGLELSFDDLVSVPTDWEDALIEFEVGAEPAPPPDETSAASISRVLQLIPGGPYYSRAYRGYEQEKQRLEEPHAECSAFVGEQATGYCQLGGRPSLQRDYFVELEAEGAPLGYFVNGLFLPGHCRGAFFPEPHGPWSIQTVTATGLGTAAVFAGAVERVVPAPLELPLLPFAGPERLSWWDSASSCSAAPLRASPNPLGAFLSLLLVSCAARARRALCKPPALDTERGPTSPRGNR